MRSELIKARGKRTQADVSKSIGISQKYLSKIELGQRTPSLKTSIKIASYYGRSVDQLFPDIFYQKSRRKVVNNINIQAVYQLEVKNKMSNISEKTSSNVFYKARCNASKYNDLLSSREGAAEMLSIDRGRLYKIEKGCATPYSEEIHLMADLYNAPELENYFCTNMCPLGGDMPKADMADLDRISIKALSTFRKIGETKDLLLDITEDGVIDEAEKADMQKILENLDELEQVAQSLKLWVKKNL
jgi:transcriptional regulator with XRE-family HTH domain